MTKKNRTIILIACVLVFFIIAPYMILYSLGYRVDVWHFKITGTGGVYVKALPYGATISIDSVANPPTGIFSPYVFEQNLLPGNHAIVIKKDDYVTYQKNLAVTEKQVTKLEHVALIKEHISFTLLKDQIFPSTTKNTTITELTWSDDSSQALVNIKGDYYLLEPFLSTPNTTPLPLLAGTKEVSFGFTNQFLFIKNKNLYSTAQTLPLAKNVAAYQIKNNAITWLAQDGFLYRAGLDGANAQKISSKPFGIKKNSSYALRLIESMIFLQEDKTLFLLNPATAVFEKFYAPVNNLKVSPDGQKILYYSDHEISYALMDSVSQKVPLQTSSGTITDAFWLNNDYVIFKSGSQIIISEIDVRGNINTVSLPQNITLSSQETITTDGATIFFNQQDKKLYLLANNHFVASERLTP